MASQRLAAEWRSEPTVLHFGHLARPLDKAPPFVFHKWKPQSLAWDYGE